MRVYRVLAVILGACLVWAASAGSLAQAAGTTSKKTQKSQKASIKPAPKASVRASSTKKTTRAPSKKVTQRSKVQKKSKSPAQVTRVKAVSEPDFDRDGSPLLRSAAFVVQDLNSGAILLEKNAELAVPIASITKLMTAILVLDAHQDLNEVLEVTDEDVDRLKGTSSHVPVGTRLTREELMRLALMSSENRAASSLARHYPGGMVGFLVAAHEKARSLGLRETRINDATGLNKDNVASARDLASLVATASRYPLIREFSTASEYAVNLRGRMRTFHNTNALVRNSDWQIGVSKTGFINESGKCLVMQAWLANKPIAIVLLDSSGRFTRISDANRVRKWVETSLTQQDKVASAGGRLIAN